MSEKITNLVEKTTQAVNDETWVTIVDTSDTSQSATGTNKRIRPNLLFQEDRGNYKIIPSTFDWTNIPSSYANCTWELIYDFDLDNNSIVLPENVILKFNGGTISNYNTFSCVNTFISSDYPVFDSDLSGTFSNNEIKSVWFGFTEDSLDVSDALRYSIITANSNLFVTLPKGDFTADNLDILDLTQDLNLKGQGIELTILRGNDNSEFNLNVGVSNVRIEGISFRNFENGIIRPNSLAQVMQNIDISGCSFIDTASTAIRIETQIEKAYVYNNYIKGLNGVDNSNAYGIVLGDDDIINTLDNEIIVENNIIEDVVVIGDNTRCKAISCYGRNIKILNNTIKNVKNNLGEQGADGIYTKSTYSTIRGNYLYNAGGQYAIATKGRNLDDISGKAQGYRNIIDSNHIIFDENWDRVCQGIVSFEEGTFIRGNILTNVTGTAVEFTDIGNGKIEGNQFINCGGDVTDGLYWLVIGNSTGTPLVGTTVINNTFSLSLAADTSLNRSHKVMRFTHNFENLLVTGNVINLDTLNNDGDRAIRFGEASTASSHINISNNNILLQGAGEAYGILTQGTGTDGLSITNNYIQGATTNNVAELSTAPTNTKVFANDNLLTRTRKGISATTYTLQEADKYLWLEFTNAAGCTVTIPDLLFNQGDEIEGDVRGTGATVTFQSDGSFILNNRAGTTPSIDEDGMFKLRFRTNHWGVLSGDLN